MTNFKSLLAVICCSIFLFACGGSKTADDVATEFVTNLYDAKVSAAVSLIYLGEEDADMTKQMITSKFDAMLPKQKKEIDEKAGGVKNIAVTKSEVDEKNNKAKVTVTVTYNKEYHGSDKKVHLINLVKVKDSWKVVM